jgi:hypothetical protein
MDGIVFSPVLTVNTTSFQSKWAGSGPKTLFSSNLSASSRQRNSVPAFQAILLAGGFL